MNVLLDLSFQQTKLCEVFTFLMMVYLLKFQEMIHINTQVWPTPPLLYSIIQYLTRKNDVLQDLGSRGCCVDEAHLGTLQSCLAMVTPQSVHTAVNNTNRLLL